MGSSVAFTRLKVAATFPANRYWAGRHHAHTVVTITIGLAQRFGDLPFSATAIDELLDELVAPGKASSSISKGKRWAYLQVQRDIGLIVQSARGRYRLTSFGLQLAEDQGRWREILARAIFRTIEPGNPLHSLLNIFIEPWSAEINTFVLEGVKSQFKRTSETAFEVDGLAHIEIQGFGKNELNLVFNGLLPFVEEIGLLAQFDANQEGNARVYAPVRDWTGITPEELIEPVRHFVEANYPPGRMISLSQLVDEYWVVARYSPALTMEALYLVGRTTAGAIHLVRAPFAVAEALEHSHIVKPGATFGAFVRRPA
jgi:hypothetical protein